MDELKFENDYSHNISSACGDKSDKECFLNRLKIVSSTLKEWGEETGDSSFQHIRILIIEDDVSMCNKYREASELFSGLEVIAMVPNGREAIKLLFKMKEMPDVVLSEISLPVMGGLEFIEEMKKISSSTSVIIVTEKLEKKELFQALRAGAGGYLLKDETSWGELGKAIEKSFCGKIPLSSKVSALLVKEFLSWMEYLDEARAEDESSDIMKDMVFSDKITCSYCNRFNKIGANYCNECGKRLPEFTSAKKYEKSHSRDGIDKIFQSWDSKALWESGTEKNFAKEIYFRERSISPSRATFIEQDTFSKIKTILKKLSVKVPEVSKTVAIMRKKLKQGYGLNRLMNYLRAKDLNFRFAVLALLFELEYREEVIAYLLKGLKDKDEDVRKLSVIALGEFGGAFAIEPLKKAEENDELNNFNMKTIIYKAIQKIEARKDI